LGRGGAEDVQRIGILEHLNLPLKDHSVGNLELPGFYVAINLAGIQKFDLFAGFYISLDDSRHDQDPDFYVCDDLRILVHVKETRGINFPFITPLYPQALLKTEVPVKESVFPKVV
jgi:hypothetical protein